MWERKCELRWARRLERSGPRELRRGTGVGAEKGCVDTRKPRLGEEASVGVGAAAGEEV